MVRYLLFGAALVAAPFSMAATLPDAARQADVIFLGERHDNAAHHAVQAEWVAALQPRAIVFEMLTPEQADRITPDLRSDMTALEDALQWHAAGWPDFSMYYPIFQAAPHAEIFGAGIPRDALKKARGNTLGAAPDAARYGLDTPLPAQQQAMREALQAHAHCDALPPDTLPMMVDIQRLRDAALAQAALTAMNQTGGPVAVITGNGHARPDWGAPTALAHAAPELTIFSLGQGEGGLAPAGGFQMVTDAAGVDRGDPCAAFDK